MQDARLDPAAATAFAAVFAATLLTSAPQASAETMPVASRPERAMLEELEASTAHPSLGANAALFDRLVGVWDCAYTTFADDGRITHFSGQLLFGWVLDGRAQQDIWISYPPGQPAGERNIGTSIRIFDAKSNRWKAVWVAASSGFMIQLEGGAEGQEVIFRGRDSDGSLLRWSFDEIRADSFVWRGEVSADGGASWRIQEEHRMTRRNAGSH